LEVVFWVISTIVNIQFLLIRKGLVLYTYTEKNFLWLISMRRYEYEMKYELAWPGNFMLRPLSVVDTNLRVVSEIRHTAYDTGID